MTETTILYNLLESKETGTYSVRNGFSSPTEAKQYADSCTGRDEREFKIQSVFTFRSIEEIFTIPGLPPPSLEDIAGNMASVYAQSIDWSDEDYTRLSEEDKAKVRQMVEEDTDDCENCGWTFQADYLSHGTYGNVCDSCERELAEADEEEDDDNED